MKNKILNKMQARCKCKRDHSHASKHITRSTSPLLASRDLSTSSIIDITTITFPRPLRSLFNPLRCKSDFLLANNTSLSDTALGLSLEVLGKIAKGTIPTVGVCVLVLGLRGRDGHLGLLCLVAGFAVVGRGDAVLVDGVVVAAVVATLDTALLSFCCCVVDVAF
jgi:hypothetical protein